MGIRATGDAEDTALADPSRSEGEANSMAGLMSGVREVQSSWAKQTLEERCATLLSCRDALIDEAESLASGIVEETGKPRFEALLHEVLILADLIGYYAKQAPRILAPEVVEMHLLRYRRSYLHYAPRGVVLVIAPWNLPLVGPFGVAVSALLAGNGVIVKPSGLTPQTAISLAQVFETAGLPKGLLQVIPGGAAEGKALIEVEPDFVSFTGTSDTGREVAARAGRI